MDELKIQKEIIELPRDPALDELKERLVREHEEKESATTRKVEKDPWIRTLLQEIGHVLKFKTHKSQIAHAMGSKK